MASIVTSMPIDKEKLKVAISIFQKAEEGYICPSELVKLQINVSLNIKLGEKLPLISSFLQYISQDISNIETITDRLAWERDLWSNGQIDVGAWMEYAQCDIDLFHIELRSIFDYLAKILKRVSVNPEEVPDGGFNDLKNWLTKSDENAEKLGKDLAKLVSSVDWFENIKNVRDTNVHRGGMTLVFLEKGRILFQVYKGYDNLISIPEIMFNENVVDFELYAGMYYGYLIAFLEGASRMIEKRLPPRKSTYGAGNPRRMYRELPAVCIWIERLLEKA